MRERAPRATHSPQSTPNDRHQLVFLVKQLQYIKTMWFKSFAALSAATALGVKGQASSDQPSPTSASASASQPSGSASASASASALPTWSWTNGTQKMHGVNLGNWLILECVCLSLCPDYYRLHDSTAFSCRKWMANDWFAEACGNETAEDQWCVVSCPRL